MSFSVAIDDSLRQRHVPCLGTSENDKSFSPQTETPSHRHKGWRSPTQNTFNSFYVFLLITRCKLVIGYETAYFSPPPPFFPALPPPLYSLNGCTFRACSCLALNYFCIHIHRAWSDRNSCAVFKLYILRVNYCNHFECF